MGSFFLLLDALFLIGYGSLCVFHSELVCQTIFTKISIDAVPFAATMCKFSG